MGVLNLNKLYTLATFSFPFIELNKEWGYDKRKGFDALQRFLFLNHRSFDFLGIKADIETIGNDPYLRLRTSKYAGSIPLLSPNNGKPYADLGVGGRFGEDVSELLSIVGDTLLPEYEDSLPQLRSSIIESPLYFECCNFIDKWIEVEHAHWHRFNVIQKIEQLPNSGTRWDVYALNSFEPQNALRYPNKTSKLNPLHHEFRQMLSILFTCIEEIKKPHVPMRSKTAYMSKILRLQAKYSEAEMLSVQEFNIHASDPIVVKEAKMIANTILQNKRTNKRAWRIDYSEFFERYVQYLFGEVAKARMAKAIKNPHYSIIGKKPTWVLQYLEPDLIFQNDDVQYVIDAKYKSHIYNWNEAGDELKDTFRHDFHQILAYCSFNDMHTKQAMLVYPFSEFFTHKIKIYSPLSHTDACINLIGIPLEKNKIEEVKKELNKLISL